ncbi:MAG: hypothetical protein QGG71_25700 [Pirellulaceae bacterium]|nr:hypothetical protein [Pirellulaceae bacterium]
MPDEDSLIDAARDAIGCGDSATDWRIVPTEHAEVFAEKAPSLAKNLRGECPRGIADMYEDQNSRAVSARDNFKRTVALADNAVFCTASLGALLLMAGGLQEPLSSLGPWVVRVIGLLGVVVSGLAAMWLRRITSGGFANEWASERAKAEAKRLAYFKAVMENASHTPLDQLLGLEYTRRFLLDNQIDYFEQRGDEHRVAAGNALNKSTLCVFVASTFTGVAGLLSVMQPHLAVVAGVGVIASAYAALVISQSAVNQNRQNADRYRATVDQLRSRRLDLDVYRKRTASGDERAVQEFFEPIFVALEADHKEFLKIAEQRESAIGDMVRRLDAEKEALERNSEVR